MFNVKVQRQLSKKMRSYFYALVAGLCLPYYSFAQSNQTSETGIFGLLQHYDPLVVAIETDLKKLKADKEEETWYPAVFKIMMNDSVALKMDVQMAARGNMRKKTCDYPPLKIRFYSQKPKNDSLADINELKLVVRCSNLPQNEEWVQREYLIYQLYNLVTEQSFRVKSATIRFEEPDKKNRSTKNFAFFLESEEELAARLQGKPLKPKVGSTRSIDSVSYDRMCLFEYMIGNTDWSVRSRHNIKLIYLHSSNSIIAVPYDFDYAGVVGTDYAIPNDNYPIQTVQERYYLGLCRSAAQYQRIFDFYLAKEKLLTAHIEQSPYLPASSKKQMLIYIEEFYKTLRDARLARRDILQNCNKGR